MLLFFSGSITMMPSSTILEVVVMKVCAVDKAVKSSEKQRNPEVSAKQKKRKDVSS